MSDKLETIWLRNRHDGVMYAWNKEHDETTPFVPLEAYKALEAERDRLKYEQETLANHVCDIAFEDKMKILKECGVEFTQEDYVRALESEIKEKNKRIIQVNGFLYDANKMCEKLAAAFEFLKESNNHEILCPSVISQDIKDCHCKWKALKQAFDECEEFKNK